MENETFDVKNAEQISTFLAFDELASRDHLTGWRQTAPCLWTNISNTEQECTQCGDIKPIPLRQPFASALMEAMASCFCGVPMIARTMSGKVLVPYTKQQYKERQRHDAYLQIRSGYKTLERLGEYDV